MNQLVNVCVVSGRMAKDQLGASHNLTRVSSTFSVSSIPPLTWPGSIVPTAADNKSARRKSSNNATKEGRCSIDRLDLDSRPTGSSKDRLILLLLNSLHLLEAQKSRNFFLLITGYGTYSVLEHRSMRTVEPTLEQLEFDALVDGDVVVVVQVGVVRKVSFSVEC